MENQKEIKTVEKIIIENGLELIISSIYKHTAGDRCQVTFEAELEVEIKDDYLNGPALSSLDKSSIKKLLGDITVFKYRRVRNFIAEDEKEAAFEGLKKQFMDNTMAYISSKSFPESLIKRNYSLAEREESLRLKREEYYRNNA